MTDDKQQTPPRTTDTPTAEEPPTPPETEARKLTVDDVETGEDVAGGALSINGTLLGPGNTDVY